MPTYFNPVHESKENKRNLPGLLGLCFFLRLIAFWGSENFAYDAVTRTEVAEVWSKTPFFISSPSQRLPPQYSPLPIYLYGLGLKLVYNTQMVPRLISLFWGTLTLIPFYLLMETIYGRRIAEVSSFFFCFYTLLIKSAVVASSESIFCFFLLMTIWQVYKYKDSRMKHHLAAAVLFMNLTAMSRYNGWFYIPLLAILLPEKWQRRMPRQEIREILFFGLGSLFFPLIWMFANWRVHGDFLYPIHFIFMDHMAVIARSGPVWSSWWNKLYLFFFWPGVLVLSLTPPVALLAVRGVFASGKIRWGIHLLIMALVPTAFIFFRVLIQGTFFPMARFAVDSGIFLLGYAGLGYEKFVNICRVKRKWCPPLIVGGLIGLSIFTLVGVGLSEIPGVSSKIRSVSALVRLEPTQKRVADYLEKHMTPDDWVVLDAYRAWSEVEIKFYSGHPRSRFFTRWGSRERLIDWIGRKKPRFLITGSHGRVWSLIQNKNLLQRMGFKAVLLEKAGKQNIYHLKPIGGNPLSPLGRGSLVGDCFVIITPRNDKKTQGS